VQKVQHLRRVSLPAYRLPIGAPAPRQIMVALPLSIRIRFGYVVAENCLLGTASPAIL
jgi:hypothetical protein